ncbi:MAG: hypothetical protein JWR02_1304 [Mucilaginibacter sp.]|nr:hypothetical protein [Mucilaginibacter sp.]
MKKLLLFLSVFCAAISAQAQTVKVQTPSSFPAIQPFGKIGIEDLQMTSCDFEKDASAEVLFDKGVVYFGADLLTITEEVYKRVKIFNDKGKDEADIKIKFYSGDRLEYVSGIQAETINLVDGKIEITKLDKKSIYTKNIDNTHSEVTFSLPNVKPGCVIEYKYNLNANSYYDFPDWYFQEKIPVRYSEFNTAIPDVFYFRAISHIDGTFAKHSTSTDGRSLGDASGTYPYNVENETRALTNVHSLPDEPFMSSFNDNVQALRFQLVSIRPIGGFAHTGSDTWAKVGGRLIDADGFGGQLKRKLNGEEAIITTAKLLKTNDEKIAYVFKEVRNSMKWNDDDDWSTNDGTPHAWEVKTGNSAEINLILYHLLKQSGVNAYPMVVSTREHGKVDPFYTSVAQFNRAVVYVPVDSSKKYVLDATGKYNIYNQIPDELLNSSGLYIDKSKNLYDIVQLRNEIPVRQLVSINAEIKPGGKLEGSVQISSTSYNRVNVLTRYKKDGEKKYTDYLRDNDNNVKISSFKMENMEIDTLPLVQNVNFNLDLAGSDENYIYLNANLFTSLKSNPFLSENRTTNIDFAYPRSYYVNGVFKIPAGYKIDALPKSVNMVTPDKRFGFKRFVTEQDGSILVRYNINYNVTEYSKEYYPQMFEFFKKMHEMLNEQIVLKKP